MVGSEAAWTAFYRAKQPSDWKTNDENSLENHLAIVAVAAVSISSQDASAGNGKKATQNNIRVNTDSIISEYLGFLLEVSSIRVNTKGTSQNDLGFLLEVSGLNNQFLMPHELGFLLENI
ncbi:hypothetical protein [Planctomycetes bacterium K23_9]|uniref:Uncharacterized protein n=1 Tax=Stieleria marina TaxID=1930275 RepID=A0A517NN43_9BACT|nr:hypothetical protein K239x_04730 [Planctomycetes bacterium K23_9]